MVSVIWTSLILFGVMATVAVLTVVFVARAMRRQS
jgi:hypothetical protein